MQQALHDISNSLGSILPELYLALLFVVVLLVDIIWPKIKVGHISMGGLLALLAWLIVAGPPAGSHAAMMGMVVEDGQGWYLRLLITTGHLLALLFTLQFKWPEGTKRNEFIVLMLSMHIGLHLMAISQHFLMLYIAMELSSISAYLLTGYLRGNRASGEAALKYLIYGAFASGIMLFGLSLVYGLGGTMSLPLLSGALATAPELSLTVALALVFVGFAFKAALLPFHFWAPGTYRGAAWPATIYLATAGKVAAIGLILRWMQALPPTGLWLQLLIVIAVSTMILGNIAAYAQKNYRRLIAFSGIGHAGLLLLATLVDSDELRAGLLYYLAVYMAMTFIALYTGYWLSQRRGTEDFDKWTGAALKSPLIAFMLLVSLVSLAGLPPTAGFTAKLNLFLPLWQWYQSTQSDWVFVGLLVGVLSSVVGLYYYLRPILFVFLRKGDSEESTSKLLPVIELILTIGLLFFGLFGFDFVLEALQKI